MKIANLYVLSVFTERVSHISFVVLYQFFLFLMPQKQNTIMMFSLCLFLLLLTIILILFIFRPI